jgi:hypothetical protein
MSDTRKDWGGINMIRHCPYLHRMRSSPAIGTAQGARAPATIHTRAVYDPERTRLLA